MPWRQKPFRVSSSLKNSISRFTWWDIAVRFIDKRYIPDLFAHKAEYDDYNKDEFYNIRTFKKIEW